jgi:hypothetical protein
MKLIIAHETPFQQMIVIIIFQVIYLLKVS